MNQPSASAQPPQKACRVCGEAIQVSARKCIHCTSYQDVRRYFGFSSTILSLLVALFAVIGQAAPAIKSIFHKPEADITYAVQDASFRRLTILVVNDGDRSGAVSSGLLKTPTKHSLLTLMDNDGVVLLAPKANALLTFAAMADPGVRPDSNETCQIAIPVTDQEGMKEFGDRSMPCGVIASMFASN